MKKDVVQQKSCFTATQIYDFTDLEPLVFLLCFTFFVKIGKLTFIYLFNLNMSNIKLEAFSQECSKKKVF